MITLSHPVFNLVSACALRVFVLATLAPRTFAADFFTRDPFPPSIPQHRVVVTDFGAVADGVTLNTEAIQRAINACGKSGGGQVVIPAGVFLTGPIEMASHVALVLAKDSVLQASPRFADFGLPDPLPDKQLEIDAFRKQLRPLISGTGLQDVAILGEGTIDGAGAGWWAQSDKMAERATNPNSPAEAAPITKPLYVPRPHLVVLRDSTRLHVRGVTLRNSPMFHLVPSRCNEVLVEDVTILSPADSPNTDGIDPANCSNILIRRCTIDTGDDNIALKAGSGGRLPTENVTVTDCKFLHGHGVSIGSETEAGVRNFLVQRCSFENTGTALRIKSDRTRGGLIQHVTYRDIAMKNVESAITVFLFYDDRKSAVRPELKPVTDATPKVQNILFQNITCEGTTKKAGEIVGLPESPIADVSLENVRITGAAAPFTQQDVRNLRTINLDVQTVNALSGNQSVAQ